MKIDHLIIMANQIGDFFKSYPDQSQAKKDIAQHIARFWALSMRQQILKHVLDKKGEGLEVIVSDAISEHLNNQDVKLHLQHAENHYLGQ
ncbi:MAG: formate dehydrogenase subunit delta [Methylotenera sp.]|nr:formate dehydrogenase subunit delta [Methylotenera sp.]